MLGREEQVFAEGLLVILVTAPAPRLCVAMLCYARLRNATLCYAKLCCATLCYAMQGYATLCYTVLCYATPRYACVAGACLRKKENT